MLRSVKGHGGYLALAGLLGVALPSARGENSARLTLRAEGLRSPKGKMLCLLFSAPEGFPLDPQQARAATESPVHEGVALCEFRNMPPGRYAICGFHDENGNEELDLNGLGLPKEGIVATRNAPMRFGPPKFRDAVFDYPGGEIEVRAKMRY